MSWPTPTIPPGVVAGAGVVTTSAAYDALVAAEALVPGTSYFIPELPAMWGAWSTSEVFGMAFTDPATGNSYVGDALVGTQSEVDIPAGTFATRPTSDPDVAGRVCYRRMTDVGVQPGGTVMSWLCGTSTEWRVTTPTWVVLSMSLVAGAAQTALQVINPSAALPAGLLKACSFFDIRDTPSKTSNSDTMTPTPYLGPNGTTADTALNPHGTVTTSGQNKGFEQSYKVVDNSTIALLGGNVGNGSWGGNEGSAAALPTYAVDVTAALKLSLGCTMSGTTSTPGCAFLGLRLNP